MSNVNRTTRAGDAGNAITMICLDTLIELIFRRLALAEDVAAEKFVSGRPIDDPDREREILQSVSRILHGAGPYTDSVVQFFRDQITASKVIQRGWHEYWRVHPEELPPVSRDLAGQLRPRLDRITWRMLWPLVYLNELPNLGWVQVQALIDRRIASEPVMRWFQGLRRDATVIALRSFV